ncbi:hypothetical protein [Kordia jejudonensis]|uniref:hypothetical protein n=1 Tax=Kordia jejudonensis TaxID=1348245 RepID=UPI000629B6D8|nr:hypothetical protein [Kordia jejudonensis]
MKEQDFNPVITAIVSIRKLAKALRGNWSDMIKNGNELEASLTHLDTLVVSFGNDQTKQDWNVEMTEYKTNLAALKTIMDTVQAQTKAKNSEGITASWSSYKQYVTVVERTFNKLASIGKRSLPEIEIENWQLHWSKINAIHTTITQEAEACLLQLNMIENYTPKEVDELSATILKYIPLHYSQSEAKQYTDEYMQAYTAIKREASQKKNLWDKFLDMLAGGIEQTPAERVMMQRWVDGEKGEAH